MQEILQNTYIKNQQPQWTILITFTFNPLISALIHPVCLYPNQIFITREHRALACVWHTSLRHLQHMEKNVRWICQVSRRCSNQLLHQKRASAGSTAETSVNQSS